MVPPPRKSNKKLKEELKAQHGKSEEEYGNWYSKLSKEEAAHVDSLIKTAEKAKAAKEGNPSREDPEKEESDDDEEAEVSSQVRQSAKLPSEITDVEISTMWTIVDAADVNSMDQEFLRIFEYQGFNPRKIFAALYAAKKKNQVSDASFVTDILTLCSISIIKGSVNSNNIKKISEEGQQEIARLETLYGIKRGSGRKEKPEVVTISRIGATFPGKIIQLICAGKVEGRTFIGPFSSSSLPVFMRHQAFAAVIPRSLRQKSRDFLLGLITAFSVDQSLQINPNKKEKQDPVILFATQSNFISVTHNGQYPPEHTKIAIFKTLIINYEDLLPTSRKIASIMGEFSIPSKDEFRSELALLE
ncbi:nucleocapsid protein [Edgeworthia chrysantha mosaic-associated virus]|uniref:Nucleoprotein n=1 Tax=Edgeworthia chrysantha mosaic-associated virus TaxID=2992856 RepID=A0A9E7V730_9VIRU|nr:nucleocapsid protein [Edgeworthia chrysantha mosaic-associated virus]